MQRMKVRLHVPSRLEHLAEAQQGYFTAAQASAAGLRGAEIERGVQYGQIRRLDSGVYRVVGAGYDAHETLRVAWLRLTHDIGPIDRLYEPTLWVAGRSAAIVHGFGDFIADVPEFISTRRRQPRMPATIAVRSAGLANDEWMISEGFAVTSVVRTFTDLVAANRDGGHIGGFLRDALHARAVELGELVDAAPASVDVAALLAMAEK